MLDAVALERRGVRAVTIVWDMFEGAARAAARLNGMLDLRIVVTPGRRGADGIEDQRAKAGSAVAGVIELLLDRQPPA